MVFTLKEDMFQLEQLLRSNKEEMGREPEAAVQVNVGRWRSMGLAPGSQSSVTTSVPLRYRTWR